jgi:hypothetical protein
MAAQTTFLKPFTTESRDERNAGMIPLRKPINSDKATPVSAVGQGT